MPGRIFRCAKLCAEVLLLAVFYEDEAEQRKKNIKNMQKETAKMPSLLFTIRFAV